MFAPLSNYWGAVFNMGGIGIDESSVWKKACVPFVNLLSVYTQSTLVISKSKGPSKTLRDIRSSTYQICSIKEKNRTTKFRK